MRSSVFVDLDYTLIRSFTMREVQDHELVEGQSILKHCRKTYAGVVSLLRPGAREMLSKAGEVANVYLLTAAQLGYAKSVLNTFELSGLFTRFYSTVYHGPNTIAADLRLAGSPWLLIDDLAPDDNMAIYKLHCLGMRPELASNSIFINRHYLQVPAYNPSLSGTGADFAMTEIAESIQHRIKSLEKRMIKH